MSIRTWTIIHKWTSLICTVFLLILCITGLPLVFKDAVDQWLAAIPAKADMPAGTPKADLDTMIETARGAKGLFRGETVRWVSLEDDRPEVWVALAPFYLADRKLDHIVRFDAYSGHVLEQRLSASAAKPTLMGIMFWLHKSLLAGLAGELFLGLMGILFVIATISGAVLYSPFMRKLDFGTVRNNRASNRYNARLKWLDLHNLLGITTLAWLLVVGLTGVMNEISEPLYNHWRSSVMNTMLKPFEDKTTAEHSAATNLTRADPVPLDPAPLDSAPEHLAPENLSSAQQAVNTVASSLPNMKIRSVRFPDGELGSPHHYLIWAIGNTPLTSRLFQPALVDARTGKLSGIGERPWYLTAVQLARPLHFGDYGGLPLKIMWVLLDMITIIILVSGLYLWLSRRKQTSGTTSKLRQVSHENDKPHMHSIESSRAISKRQKNSLWRIWKHPVWLAILTTTGLLTAFLGTTLWSSVAWLAISIPIIICAWFGLHHRSKK